MYMSDINVYFNLTPLRDLTFTITFQWDDSSFGSVEVAFPLSGSSSSSWTSRMNLKPMTKIQYPYNTRRIN